METQTESPAKRDNATTGPRVFPDPREQPTMTIPEAGSWVGLNRNGAYAAAAAGILPTIAISAHKRVVPTAALAAKLGLDAA